MIKLPIFDTGQYNGCELLMKNGEAKLIIKFLELADFSITFSKVRWHQFTALPNCTTVQINSSYFRLTNFENSPELKIFLASDKSPLKAYKELHHYCIFLDETGCHEFFAESACIAV
ncbi:hypothetical protein [Alkanindiges illinoisensis]|uniref:hypothetical protein n=1 Tax=Alkanindiges illinoisensis TaxID=197183 RepID=UPI0012EB2E6D|nr:hypothetical protein [Alkanindiges illinoisensis]